MNEKVIDFLKPEIPKSLCIIKLCLFRVKSYSFVCSNFEENKTKVIKNKKVAKDEIEIEDLFNCFSGEREKKLGRQFSS